MVAILLSTVSQAHFFSGTLNEDTPIYLTENNQRNVQIQMESISVVEHALKLQKSLPKNESGDFLQWITKNRQELKDASFSNLKFEENGFSLVIKGKLLRVSNLSYNPGRNIKFKIGKIEFIYDGKKTFLDFTESIEKSINSDVNKNNLKESLFSFFLPKANAFAAPLILGVACAVILPSTVLTIHELVTTKDIEYEKRLIAEGKTRCEAIPKSKSGVIYRNNDRYQAVFKSFNNVYCGADLQMKLGTLLAVTNRKQQCVDFATLTKCMSSVPEDNPVKISISENILVTREKAKATAPTKFSSGQ